jgi:hypothetical protein
MSHSVYQNESLTAQVRHKVSTKTKMQYRRQHKYTKTKHQIRNKNKTLGKAYKKH